MNLDVDAARIKRRIQISELEEMRHKAYESATIYKERMKRWYDKILQPKEFKQGDKVLLFNSKFKIFGKGKWDGTVCCPLGLTKWSGSDYGYKRRPICG
jgi:hypothetical protein